jgi:hypothetical protein
MTTQERDEHLGRLAYEAYAAQTGGVSLASGDRLPSWDALGDEFKTAWVASARTVESAIRQETDDAVRQRS